MGPFWFDEIEADGSVSFVASYSGPERNPHAHFDLVKIFLSALEKCINIHGSDLSHVLLSVSSAHDLFCSLEAITQNKHGIQSEGFNQMIIDQFSSLQSSFY
ncbi:hypothetical protein Ciccas_000751 [Cichlidogyrus casuarinus]|uniref:Uncharacterized protein n=1 Tax=Cichlidogyrus casuarinus TaxID=1844966 RepID=A0ABD2QMB6_9PLAT